MRSWRWYSKVLFALLAAAFAYWVWPTPWRYDHWEGGGAIRTHRVTGRMQVLRDSGWVDLRRAGAENLSLLERLELEAEARDAQRDQGR
jgi:hypothetical protein